MTAFEKVTPRLPTNDLARTIGFYRDMLGFELSVLWPEKEPTFCLVDRDRIRLGFYRAELADRAGVGSAQITLHVSDILGLHRALSARGIGSEWGPEVYSYGCREFAIRDPNGYMLIFSEETDDPPICDVEG